MDSEFTNPRHHLLAAGASFVTSIKTLQGVIRIAAVGSITTDKRNPKDIDFLVTVADNVELDKLAAAGRRLKGTAQTKSLGADIFLANEQNQYIGRTCGWKVCEPGIRIACRADNCGKRKYLNDDVSDLILSSELVKNPPIILWPRLEVKTKLPEDVARILLHG